MWFRKPNENNTAARGAAMFRLPVFAFILSVLIGTCVQAQTPQNSSPMLINWQSGAIGTMLVRYTVTRKRAEAGYDKNRLRRLDRLPTNLPNALAIASMGLKFIGRDPSVVLVSEGLGSQKWHGRIVILTNEHTVSAGEMVAAFAKENALAKIVGTETAGRLNPPRGSRSGMVTCL